jgi:hypothetical protein
MDLPTEAATLIRDQQVSLAAIRCRRSSMTRTSEAFIVGFRAVMAIAAGLALASAGVAWLMIRPASRGGS